MCDWGAAVVRATQHKSECANYYSPGPGGRNNFRHIEKKNHTQTGMKRWVLPDLNVSANWLDKLKRTREQINPTTTTKKHSRSNA